MQLLVDVDLIMVSSLLAMVQTRVRNTILSRTPGQPIGAKKDTLDLESPTINGVFAQSRLLHSVLQFDQINE